MNVTESSFSRVVTFCRLLDSKICKSLLGSTVDITIIVKGMLQKDGSVVSSKVIDSVFKSFMNLCLVNQKYIKRDGAVSAVCIPIGDKGNRLYSFPTKEVRGLPFEATFENIAFLLGKDVFSSGVNEGRQLVSVSVRLEDVSGRKIYQIIDSIKASTQEPT